MSPEHFLKLLKGHDWYFMYSDDPETYRRGLRDADTIRALVRENPELQRIYEEFRAGANSPMTV